MKADRPTEEDLAFFAPWLERWDLVPDGAPLAGNSSRLLPVRRSGQSLMLKAVMEPREVHGSAFLHWLDGLGAAKVFARQDDAVLIERLTGKRSLVEMEAAGEEAAALTILCDVAACLHAARARPPADLYPLSPWFDQLRKVAAEDGGTLRRALVEVEALLDDRRQACALHGDLHHWNVLDGGARGWLAIDPSGVIGERTFDFALMVLPANLIDDKEASALRRRAALVAELADLDPRRLLAWVMGQAALWAAWSAPGRDWIAIAEAAGTALDEVGKC